MRGLGSTWFHERKEGDHVHAFAPNGRFCPELNSDRSKGLVLIAGGIGITPVLSIIRSEIDSASKRPISLFYAASRVDDMIFHKLLIHLDALA